MVVGYTIPPNIEYLLDFPQLTTIITRAFSGDGSQERMVSHNFLKDFNNLLQIRKSSYLRLSIFSHNRATVLPKQK